LISRRSISTGSAERQDGGRAGRQDMADFKEKFAKVFKKTPLQLTFDDINWSS
jgi:hypothetical protein